MGMVLLVRHGQASFGAADYDVLSEVGVQQSRRLGECLAAAGVVPASLLHGAMVRQRDTAVAMAEGAGWSLEPGLDEGWNEFDHLGVIARAAGSEEWSRLRSTTERARSTTGEARSTTEEGDGGRRAFQGVFEAATARWAGGEHDHEYDESWPAFFGRVSSALVRACEQVSDQEGPTVVVSSGGPIAVACASLVDPDATWDELSRAGRRFDLWRRFNTQIVNASVTRVVIGSTGRRLLTYNEHAHLSRDLVTYR